MDANQALISERDQRRERREIQLLDSGNYSLDDQLFASVREAFRAMEQRKPVPPVERRKRLTYEATFEEIFARRIPAFLDEVILEHDSQDGRKIVFQCGGKWTAGVELPTRNMLLLVLQTAKIARQIHFGVRLNEGKFAKATYESPDGRQPEPEHFMAWLREQVTQSLAPVQ